MAQTFTDKPYFLDNDYPEIVVALERKSNEIPDKFDRIVWHKQDKRFIYGDYEGYMVYHGDEEEPWLDTSIAIQNIIKDGYKTGLTQCGSSFYDDGTKLYEVTSLSAEHKLIFDASKTTL